MFDSYHLCPSLIRAFTSNSPVIFSGDHLHQSSGKSYLGQSTDSLVILHYLCSEPFARRGKLTRYLAEYIGQAHTPDGW